MRRLGVVAAVLAIAGAAYATTYYDLGGAGDTVETDADYIYTSSLRFTRGTTDAAAPSADQAKHTAFAPSNFAFPFPSIRTPNERAWRNLPALMSGWATACLLPGRRAQSTLNEIGVSHNVVDSSTVSNADIANTNLMTSMRRTTFTGNAAASRGAGTYSNTRMVWRGNAAGLGGFLFYARWGTSTAVANQRAFIGVHDSISAINPASEPSAMLDTAYVGYDAAQTTLRVCTNDGTSSATCTNLGANFPVNSTAVYDVWLYSPPNGSRIDYWVERLDSAQNASGTITTDLPRNTLMLQMQAAVSNGGTTSSAVLELARYCVTSPI